MTAHRGTDNKERRMTLALVQSQAKTSWFGQQDISKNLPPLSGRTRTTPEPLSIINKFYGTISYAADIYSSDLLISLFFITYLCHKNRVKCHGTRLSPACDWVGRLMGGTLMSHLCCLSVSTPNAVTLKTPASFYSTYLSSDVNTHGTKVWIES